MKYIIENNEVTITGCGDFCKGDVVIPGAIDGYPVTRIGDCAFDDCTNLTSITIGDSITSIGDGAFSDCTNLTSIIVDSNNTKYSSDSYGILFNKDKTELIQYPRGNTRTTYTIPDSVTSIDDFAFYDCRSLTSVIIGNSVTIIGRRVFFKCANLINVTIGNSVTTIDNSVFGLCTSLKSPLANYKAFDLHSDGKISCRDYEFQENKWSDEIKNVQLCESGYHYCTNLFEIFNYYSGTLDKDIAIYLCDVGDEVVQSDASKCVTNKIKPVKRLYREDVIKILNEK